MMSVSEYDGSVSDFVERVRAAFDRQHAQTMPAEVEASIWWVQDVFDDHIIVRSDDRFFRIGMTVTDEEIKFDPPIKWQAVKLSYVSEIRHADFKGDFPEVPTYDHVDTELLYQGDEKPFHVVLPIARVGETSANGMVYDDKLVKEIEDQLPGLGGIRGHNFNPNEFPVEDHDVIGHKRVEDTLWAKIYIPPGEKREETRRRKARGGRVATSIFGPMGKRESLKGGKWTVRGLKLESLDFGPVTRTALNLNGGEFAVVSELTDEDDKENDMDREQVIAELTVDDLPESLRKQIVAEYQHQQDAEGVVAELRSEISDKDNVIAELQKKVNGFEEMRFTQALDGMIAEMVNVELLRPIVRRAVVAELEERTEDAAKAALTAYLETEEYTQLAKAMVAEMTGPGAFVGAQRNSGNWREELAKNAEALAREKGVH